MNRSTIEALALVLGRQSREILQVLYFGAEIVLPTADVGPYRPYDVISVAEGDDYRKKYAEYQGGFGYDGIQKTLERTDFSALTQPERLAELLEIHPRLLGQMLRPDVYAAVAPEALAGSLFSQEVYERVCHRIKAVPAREVLRQYLIDRLSQLKAEDDAACRRENGCDRVDLPILDWMKEEDDRASCPVAEETLWEKPPAPVYWPFRESPEEEWEERI